MQKETTITGYIIYDPVSDEAICEKNFYLDANPDTWHIYPSERAAKAGKTSFINSAAAEHIHWPNNPNDSKRFEQSQTVEVRLLTRKTTYEF